MISINMELKMERTLSSRTVFKGFNCKYGNFEDS